MSRAEKLQQAQAALYVGFGDGCWRAGCLNEASAWYRKATYTWPSIREDLAAETAHVATQAIYTSAHALGEGATDDAATVRA